MNQRQSSARLKLKDSAGAGRLSAFLLACTLLVASASRLACAIQIGPPGLEPSSPKQPLPSQNTPPPIASSQDSHAPQTLKVRWAAGKLSVDAEGAPLLEVLRTVSRQTGIVVTGAQGLREPVFAHLAELSLRQALDKLLCHLNYAIIAATSSSPRGMRAVIFKSGQVGFQSSEATASSNDTEDLKLKEIEDAVKQRDRHTLRRLIHDNDPTVQAAAFDALAGEDKDMAVSTLVASARGNSDAVARLQSLQLLERSGVAEEQLLVSTLRDALQDPDPSISASAIQSLAGQGGAGAIDALSTALHSSDRSTRLLVIQSVAGTAAAVPLLREALSDQDETVSSLAATLLKQSEASSTRSQ